MAGRKRHMAEKPDSRRDAWMLKGVERGVQRWRFVFPARCDDTGEIRIFYIEYYACAPDTEPPEKRRKLRIRRKDRKEEAPHVVRPSSFAVHAGIIGDPDARYTYTFPAGEASFQPGPPFVATAGECLFTEFESYGSIPREDVSGAGISGTDASGTGTSGSDTSGVGTSGNDTSGVGTSGNDTSGAGTSGKDTSGAGISGTAGEREKTGNRTFSAAFRTAEAAEKAGDETAGGAAEDDGFYDHEFGTMADDTRMEWDLEFDKDVPLGTGAEASPGMQKLENTGMRWHAEGFVTRFTGIVIADDVSYRAFPDAGPGYSDVNWGSGFPSPGIWLWSSALYRKSTGEPVHGASFAFWGGEDKRALSLKPAAGTDGTKSQSGTDRTKAQSGTDGTKFQSGADRTKSAASADRTEPLSGRTGGTGKSDREAQTSGIRIDGMLRMGGRSGGKDSYLFIQTPFSGTSYLKCREDEKWFEWHIILTSQKAMADIRVVCEKTRMFPDDLPSPENRLRTYRRWTGADGRATIILSRRQTPLGSFEKTEELTAEHVVCSYGSYLRPTS